MIPHPRKFPLRTGFLAFQKRAKQITTPHLRALFNPHAPSRLSVIVPLKVNKRAVTRNSLKRLVYDLAWKSLGDKNLDCVIIFKPLSLLNNRPSKELISHELSQAIGLL